MAGQAIRYTVRFPLPATNYAEVEGRFPTGGTKAIELFLAVWTPGSYLVREYARHIEGVRAATPSGEVLRWEKVRKNRWRIETGGEDTVVVRYRLYCREMSVRTNWVEDGFAFLNGAPTFLGLAGGLDREHVVQLELPPGWERSLSSMPLAAPEACPNRFVASDFDTLVDSPVLAGNPLVFRFEIEGILHWFANEGDTSLWDIHRSTADLERLVRRIREMWGQLPYAMYVFLNLIVEGGGGLEHKNSCCLLSSRWTMRTRKAYLEWLSLASHEFFHVWNVKRLRPRELGPFDYENENYTRSLWIAEGFTEYYGDLMVKRAGLTDEHEYLAALSRLIQKLQTMPGRLVQSAAGSSFDAWIKLYRPDENSGNSTISYYTKGAVVGWLLDARVRRATNGAKSLDDVMRLAFTRFGFERGYTGADFVSAAEEIAGVSLKEFLEKATETTEELEYSETLDWFGLRWTEGEQKSKIVLGGLETKVDGGRLVVAAVPHGTPGLGSGIAVEDEIIAIDGYRVRPEALAQRLEQYGAGDRVSVLVARREKLRSFQMELSEEPKPRQLEIRPDATDQQKRNFSDWLT